MGVDINFGIAKGWIISEDEINSVIEKDDSELDWDDIFDVGFISLDNISGGDFIAALDYKDVDVDDRGYFYVDNDLLSNDDYKGTVIYDIICEYFPEHANEEPKLISYARFW